MKAGVLLTSQRTQRKCWSTVTWHRAARGRCQPACAGCNSGNHVLEPAGLFPQAVGSGNYPFCEHTKPGSQESIRIQEGSDSSPLGSHLKSAGIKSRWRARMWKCDAEFFRPRTLSEPLPPSPTNTKGAVSSSERSKTCFQTFPTNHRSHQNSCT